MKSKQIGFTMLEVMVTVIILSIGMLGIIGMQMTSLKFSNSSSYRNMAIWQVHSMAEVMRANHERAILNQFTVSDGTTDTPTGGDAIVKTEVASWKNKIASILPSGKGSIVMLTAPIRAQITVTFDDSRAGSGNGVQSFSSEIEL